MTSVIASDLHRNPAVSPPPDLAPRDDARDRFAAAVHAGLAKPHKRLPTEYLYDERGSQLFDAICELPEYYPTRTELAIMRAHVHEMAAAIGPDATIIEYGSGSSLKTRVLLDAVVRPAAYVPVDISADYLAGAVDKLAAEYPSLCIAPVAADFTRPFDVPVRGKGQRVVYFPGSTIGNFEPAAAIALLRQMARQVGQGGSVLIGVDLRKSVDVLEPAYDDAAGVTAEFNLNLLRRIQRELGGDLDPARFRHRAYFDDERGRIVMTLVSRCTQLVSIAGQRYRFDEGEAITTEYSHKYTREGFAALAEAAGLTVAQVWTDPAAWFSVQRLVAR